MMKKNSFNYILSFLFLLSLNSVVPGSILAAVSNEDKQLALADSAYAQGRYDEALSIFNKLASEYGVSPQLYYNIGNASYKRGDTGGAVIAYLRALRLDPSFKDAKINLSFLRSHVEDLNRAELGNKKGNVSTDQPSFWQNIKIQITENHRSDSWALFALISFILFLCAISAYIWSDVVIIKKIGFFGSLAFVTISICFIVFSYYAANAWKSTEKAVILENKVSLKKTIKDSTLQFSPLHAGTEVMILEKMKDDNNENWFLVRLNNEVSGWLPDNTLGIVNPFYSSDIKE